MGGEDLGKVACLPTTGKNAIWHNQQASLFRRGIGLKLATGEGEEEIEGPV